MSELITHTARIVPYTRRPRQVASYVTVYTHEPLPNEPGAALGSFFVVLEVLLSGRAGEELADLIIETLGQHYYNHANGTPLERFEIAIKAINRELVSHVNRGNAAWIGKLSAIAGVQVESELHLAHTGSAEAFLYRGKTTTPISATPDKLKTNTPSKTFSSITSGTLEAGDRLLLATPALIHQLPLEKIHHIVSSSSPNNAIAEIGELLHGSTDRIAALVVEVTTPELAALQIRSDAPDEVQLGMPETTLETAKLAAAPLTAAALSTSKRAGTFAIGAWQRIRPLTRTVLLGRVNALRRFLTGKGSRRRLVITGGLIVVIVSGLWYWQTIQGQSQSYVDKYRTAYERYELATNRADSGDRDGAKRELEATLSDVQALAKVSSALDQKLRHSTLPSGAPTTVASLEQLITNQLDQLDDLKRPNVTTVVGFDGLKNVQPSHIEAFANKLYVVDSNNKSAIYIVNTTTNTFKASAANTSVLGKVIATTLSSNNDGMYLLTDKPTVWLYHFDTDTLTEQTINLGIWPAGNAIASYAGNLYVLADGVVYKHVRTLLGFGPKAEYLTSTTAAGLKNATSMAIDGSIYILSPSGLHQYLAGTFRQTASVPTRLSHANLIRSVGNLLLAVDPTTSRLGLWDTTQTIQFQQQYQLQGVKQLRDAVYDAKTKTAYALADGRVVRFAP